MSDFVETPLEDCRLSTELAIEPGRVTLRFSGEFDLAGLPPADRLLAEALDRPSETVVVDLRALRFLDSSGLRFLVRAKEACHDERRDLVLVRGRRVVSRVIEIAGLEGRFVFVDEP